MGVGHPNGHGGKKRPAVALVMDRASEALSRSEYLVLVAIASYADSDGRAWPSVEAIAGRARVNERTARRAIKSLEEAGGSRYCRGRRGGAPTLTSSSSPPRLRAPWMS